MEDDTSRKIDDLGLKDIKNEVLLDIFGSDKCKEKGIVDSLDEEEFIAKVNSLVEKRKSMEKVIFPERTPTFADYLRDHIEEDMKDGKLLSMRRKPGLKDKLQQFQVQSKKPKKQKCQTTLVTVLNLKCMRTKALVMYRKLVEVASRDKQMAVLQKGFFVLSEQY